MIFSNKNNFKKSNIRPDTWKVIVADNDKDIHEITNIVLSNYIYKNKRIELIPAYSGKETLELLKKHDDIVLVLLDVVMESDDAGLIVVKKIREELNNNATQIILRTGQPGIAPEIDIVKNYEINAYKEKTDLTSTQLITSTLTAIRAYENIKELQNQQNKILALNKDMEGLVNSFNKNVLVLQFDNYGIIKYASDAFCNLSTYTKYELLEKKLGSFFNENKDYDFFELIKSNVESKKTFKGKIAKKKQDNSLYHLSFVVTSNYDKYNNFLCFTAIFTDITYEVKNEEINKEIQKHKIMLFHQTKKSAMGEMIANIAHQWRQPLNNVNMIIHYLRDNCINLREDEIKKDVNDCKIQLNYMSKTIEDFTNFINPAKDLSTFNIQNTFAKILTITYSRFYEKNVELHQDVDSFDIFTCENNLMQVIINILNNASDAFMLNNKNLLFVQVFKEDKNVFIKIKDNAGGIDEKIINKIFEPYFTTKKENEGIGIGLYIVDEMLRSRLNGEISACNVEYEHENNVYKGAEFTIKINL